MYFFQFVNLYKFVKKKVNFFLKNFFYKTGVFFERCYVLSKKNYLEDFVLHSYMCHNTLERYFKCSFSCYVHVY